MTVRELRRLYANAGKELRDYFFNRVGTEQHFLRLLGWLRFITLVALTLRFGYRLDRYTPAEVVELGVALWGYLLFIVLFRFLADFRPQWFESDLSKIVQATVDLLVVAWFYAMSRDPGSEVFLFYFLPLLIIARYFDHRLLAFFFGGIVTATAITWWTTIPPSNFLSLSFWVIELLPKFGFLAVMTLFYLIYHRRKRVAGHIDRTGQKLVESLKGLQLAAFSVDWNLRLTSVTNSMRDRYGLNDDPESCYTAFCGSGSRTGKRCEECPLAAAINRREIISDVEVRFFRRDGTLCPVSITALPVLDPYGRTSGATAIVRDVEQWESLAQDLRAYAVDVERTVDMHTLEHRVRAEEMTRKLTAISRASAAVLSPEQRVGVEEIVHAAVSLLECSTASVRLASNLEGSAQPGLILHYLLRGGTDDMTKYHFLDVNEQSLVAEAFRTGKPQYSTDVQEGPGQIYFGEGAQRQGLRSCVSFPLVARDVKLGTFTLYRNRRQPFSDEETQLGEALANSLAAALFNQHLLDQISAEAAARQTKLDVLNDLSHKVVRHHSEESLTQFVAETVLKELHAEVASVFLLDGQSLRRAAIAGVKADWLPDESYQVGQGITGLAASAPPGDYYGQPILVNDVMSYGCFVPEYVTCYSKRLRTGAVQHLAAVPLNGSQGTFGVLRVMNRIDAQGRLHPAGFTQADLELLTTVGCMVAVAIENVRRLAEQRLLAAVGQKVTSSLSPESVYTHALEQAALMLDAEAGAILLKDRATGALTFAVTAGTGAERFRGLSIPAGQGVAGQVVATGRPALVPDVSRDSRFFREVDERAHFVTRSLVAIPIKTRDEVIGVLEVLNKRRGPFTDADRDLLNGLAAWLAIATENSRLYEAEQERRQLTEVLLETIQVLSSTLELDKILNTILIQLKKVVHYDSASLFLRDGDALVLCASAGFPDKEREALSQLCLDARHNIPLQLMEETKRPVILADAQQARILDKAIGAGRIRSWIGAPLLYNDQVIGQLAVDCWKPGQYDEADGKLVMAFAHHAAIAITKARLFAEQEQRARELLSLAKSLTHFSATNSLAETSERIAQIVKRSLGCDVAFVALYDHDRREISAVPSGQTPGQHDSSTSHVRFQLSEPAGAVLRERRAHVTSDVELDSSSIFRDPRTRPVGIKGLMAAPLLAGTREVGILYAASTRERQFAENDRTVFSILANHAGVAIRNVELLEDARRRTELTQLLHQISIACQRTTNLDLILNIVLTGVTAWYGLRFNRAMFLLMDASGSCLIGHSGIGQTDRREAFRVWEGLGPQTFDEYVRAALQSGPPPQTPIFRVAKELRIRVGADSQEVFSQAVAQQQLKEVDPTEDGVLIDADFRRQFNPGHIVLVPLLVDGDVIGVLVADNKWTGDPITRETLDLLEACASQAATTIARARLLEAQLERIELLDRLKEVSRDIAAFTSLQETLQSIVDAANELLSADVSYLVPYHDESKELQVELAVRAGGSGSFPHQVTFSERGLTQRVLGATEGMVILQDLKDERGLVSDFAEKEGIRSVAGIQLTFRGKIVGILYVNYHEPHRFTDQEMTILGLLADQGAISIRNAHLWELKEELATQRERDRLREDLHDALNAFHFKVMLPVEDIRDELRGQGNNQATQELDHLWKSSHYLYETFRRILQDMRDPVLVERGLVDALEADIQRIRTLAVDLQVERGSRLSGDVELAFFRIAQEAISNINKHAYARDRADRRATVKLDLDSVVARMTIEDCGSGFSRDSVMAQRNGMGLDAMYNCAARIGAEIKIDTNEGTGTRIEVSVTTQQEVDA